MHTEHGTRFTRLLVCAALVATLGGCASWKVVNPVETRLERAAPHGVVGKVGRADELMTTLYTVAFAKQRLGHELDKAWRRALEKSELFDNVIEEVDSGNRPMPASSYLLRAQMESFRVDRHQGATTAVYILGSCFLIPFAFVGLATNSWEMDASFKVRVYDVSGMSTVAGVDGDTGQRVPSFDVGQAPQLMSASFDVRVEGDSGGAGTDEDELLVGMTAELARRLLKEAGPKIKRVIAARPSPAPAPEPSPTGVL